MQDELFHIGHDIKESDARKAQNIVLENRLQTLEESVENMEEVTFLLQNPDLPFDFFARLLLLDYTILTSKTKKFWFEELHA